MPNAKDLVLKLRSITDAFKTDDPVHELEDLERSLKATGDQSTTSAREVRRAAEDLDAPGFDKAAAEAESTARRMRAAAEDMSDGFERGARDIDQTTSRMRDDMGDVGRETGSEFISNIAEGIGSGSGSLDDVVSGTLGGLTNLAASLTGPVGIAAGIAAAGIGLVFNATKAQAEAAKERVDTLMGALEELGTTSSEAAKTVIWDTWLATMKEMPGELNKTVTTLESAGITADEWKNAIKGSADAQQTVNDKLMTTAAAIQDNYARTGELTTEERAYLDNLILVQGHLDTQNTTLGQVKDQQSDINFFLDEGEKKQKNITDEISDSRKEARGLRDDLDSATKDRTVKVTVRTVDLRGKWVDAPDPRKGTSYPVHGTSSGGGVSGSYAGGYR